MACTSLPVINNGYITASTATRVEYECLAGFELVGTKVIECDATNGWPQAPSCQVILDKVSFTDESKNYFAPDWWYIFLALMLCIFLLLCVISFIWCCVCKRWGGATVYPINDNNDVEKSDNNADQAKPPLPPTRCSNQSTIEHNWKRERLLTPDDLVGKQKSGASVETNQVPPLSTSSVFVVDDSIRKHLPMPDSHVLSQHQKNEEKENIYVPLGNGWSKNDKLIDHGKAEDKPQSIEATILKETNKTFLGRNDTFSKAETLQQSYPRSSTSAEISQKPNFLSYKSHNQAPEHSTIQAPPLSIHDTNIADFVSFNDDTPVEVKNTPLQELDPRKLHTLTPVELSARDDDVTLQTTNFNDDYILQETVYYRTKKNMHPASYIHRRQNATDNIPRLPPSSGVIKVRSKKKVLDKKPMWCPHTRPVTKSFISPSYVWR